MDPSDTLIQIQTILERMGKRNITLATDLTKESILDSIELIDFIVAIQKKFGVKISEKELFSRELNRISNMVAYLNLQDNKNT